MLDQGQTIDPIIRLDASELARRIRGRDLSAAEVTEAHIGRIEDVLIGFGPL